MVSFSNNHTLGIGMLVYSKVRKYKVNRLKKKQEELRDIKWIREDFKKLGHVHVVEEN
jgi:hypothetical protein